MKNSVVILNIPYISKVRREKNFQVSIWNFFSWDYSSIFFYLPLPFPPPKFSHITPWSISSSYDFFTNGCTRNICRCILIFTLNTTCSVYKMLAVYVTSELITWPWITSWYSFILQRRQFLPLSAFISCL